MISKIFEFSQFYNSSSSSERLDENYVTTANNDYFHIFSETLEILLFDLQNYQHTEVQFIQITSEDKSELHSKEIDAELIRKGLTIEAPIPQKFKVTKQQQQQAQAQQNKNNNPSLTRLTTNTVFGKPSITKKT